jgi:1-acyl-sn-glycerol-3-phosphate acyltransferase
MIPAQHRKWADMIFRPYIFHLLRKSFHHFWLINQSPELAAQRSLLLLPNHFTWWDGFFLYYLNQKLWHKRLHIMMLQEQLERFWFFRYLGAFSIKLGNREEARRSLDYAARLLHSPANMVIIYPQGVLEPYDQRPLSFHTAGISQILRQSSPQILPVGMRIQHGEHKNPDVFCRFPSLITATGMAKQKRQIRQSFFANLAELTQKSWLGRGERDLFAS